MNAKERYEQIKSKRHRNDILLAVGFCLAAVLITAVVVVGW